MSSRQRREAQERRDRRDREEREAWWIGCASEFRCARCLEAPPTCDRCDCPAVSLVAVSSRLDRSDLGQHLHLCAPCRDEAQQLSGLPRHELGWQL